MIYESKLNKFWRNNHRFDQESRCKLNISMETSKNLQLLNQINNCNISKRTITENFSMSNLESRLNLAKSLNSIGSLDSSKTQKKSFQMSPVPRTSTNLINKINDQITNSVAKKLRVYDRQALLKRFTEDFYTLDKDMHFEFCVKN